MKLKNYFSELTFRHRELGNGRSRNHFCDIGDESQVHADIILQYPCVLYGEDAGEEFSGTIGFLRRPFSIAMLFLDHVTDTSDFQHLEDVTEHMNAIAEDFLRKAWSEQSDIMDAGSFRITPMENKDAALYGVMLSFMVEVPFCMTIEDDPFEQTRVFDETFDPSFG